MFCRKCKKEIPEQSVFCNHCGAKQEDTGQRVKARGNGYGTAYKRGKTYVSRVVIGWKPSPDGSHLIPIRRSKGGFKTKREALEYCATLKDTHNGGVKKAPTLASYWETYAANEMLKLSTSKQVAYRGAWKKLESIHYRPIDTLSVIDLRRVVAEKCPTFYTARDCKVLLNHLFELAGAEGWVSKDIPSYIILPDLEEKERQVFSDEEQRALWKLYESGDLSAAIPLVMICTGMMPGEMQNLRVESIDLEAQQITGVGMKTKVRKESPVFLPEDIIPIMEDLIANAQPSGYIWVHNEDKWYQTYYEALEKSGCRRLEPYCCRHSTATRLAITEGIAPQTIQRAMRWSSTKMLDRYAHPAASDVLAAVNTIKKME